MPLKKLLPYEGFYPQDRTVQLSKLFVEKIKKDIAYGEQIHEGQSLQAAMQHFFAPGIMYNSIKSGIACDWASYTNETGLQSSYFGQAVNEHFSTVSGKPPATKYLKRPTPSWYLDGAVSGENEIADIPPTTAADADIEDSIKHRSQEFVDSDYTDASNYTINEVVKDFVIQEAPTKRLPFEAILEPYKYLRDGTHGDLISTGFSTGSIKNASNQHFLMLPSYYEDFYDYTRTRTSGTLSYSLDTTNSKYKNYNFPYFEIVKDSSDFRYEMATNNFMAEATKFFIKDSKLKSFVSKPQSSEGYFMESGSTYYMDVVLEKTGDFNPVNSPATLGGRYFGPAVRWVTPGNFAANYSTEAEKVADPAFAPYVPPYFFARSKTRVSFTATKSGNQGYTLREILLGLNTEQKDENIAEYFERLAFQVRRVNHKNDNVIDNNHGAYHISPAYLNRMPMSSSIEMKGITNRYRISSSPEGSPIAVESPTGTEQDSWVIYSKFECPLFNFADAKSLDKAEIDKSIIETKENETFDYFASHLDPSNIERFTTDTRAGCGIWTAQGTQSEDSGVFMSIEESFQDYATLQDSGSLMQVCGFEPETQQLGRVADSKDIFEAVVMIPYLDEPLELSTNVGVTGINRVYGTVNVDDRNFIRVDAEVYENHKRIFLKKEGGRDFSEESLYTLPSPTQGPDIQIPVNSSSYTRMYAGMKKYNIPPAYDFETYNDIEPFLMYFFEFKQSLDRDDLSNIWQGIQPKIAKNAFLDSAEVNHPINENEFFGNLGGIPKGIKWMVFKVKQKAEKSYFNMTEDSRDDARFKFKFDLGSKEPEYGYNYPYDYFTMLEMIQVETAQELEIDIADLRNKTTGRREDEEQ